MTVNLQFAGDIASSLETAGLTVDTNLTIGGVKPDLMIRSPSGGAVVIDVKPWIHPSKSLLDSAAHQVELYEKKLGADKAFVVVSGLDHSLPNKGLFKAEDLVKAIFLEFDQKAVDEAVEKVVKAVLVPASKLIFAAMPFAKRYNDTYFGPMAYAAEKVGAACKRVDQEPFAGLIVDKIKRMIQSCSAVIADLSEGKPNVLYEVGYAHGLGRPTVHICATPMSELPFDVAQWNTLAYEFGNTVELREPLAESLRAVLESGSFDDRPG
jgi:hypothetical protein